MIAAAGQAVETSDSCLRATPASFALRWRTINSVSNVCFKVWDSESFHESDACNLTDRTNRGIGTVIRIF